MKWEFRKRSQVLSTLVLYFALSMELPCPRHGCDCHVPLGLAGWHLQTPYRVGMAMFLCIGWDRISIQFRRNYLAEEWNREGKMADALGKQGNTRIYGNNSVLGWRVIPQSGRQAGRACCIGWIINQVFSFFSSSCKSQQCSVTVVFSFFMCVMWDAEFLLW